MANALGPDGWRNIQIGLSFCEDGGLIIWSPDVPDLKLRGSDPQAVMAKVVPALAALNQGLPIPE